MFLIKQPVLGSRFSRSSGLCRQVLQYRQGVQWLHVTYSCLSVQNVCSLWTPWAVLEPFLLTCRKDVWTLWSVRPISVYRASLDSPTPSPGNLPWRSAKVGNSNQYHRALFHDGNLTLRLLNKSKVSFGITNVYPTQPRLYTVSQGFLDDGNLNLKLLNKSKVNFGIANIYIRPQAHHRQYKVRPDLAILLSNKLQNILVTFHWASYSPYIVYTKFHPNTVCRKTQKISLTSFTGGVLPSFIRICLGKLKIFCKQPN